MNLKTLVPAAGSERELMVSRTIDARRECVFNVWTTRLPEWWGPHGVSTPVCELELRAGGIFRTVMRGPDGAEFPTRGIFLEVVAPERIVFTDAFDPGWQPRLDAFFTAVTTFEALSDHKTNCTVRALHWTVASREKHEKMGFHQGWKESLDRLACVAVKN